MIQAQPPASPNPVQPALPEPFHLQAGDGHRFEAALYRAAQPAAPLLLWFPALGVRQEYYRHFAQSLAGQGVHVLTFDHRGHGTSSVRPNRHQDFGLWQMVSQDYPAALALAQKLFGSNPRLIGGHSLGGHLATVYLSLNPSQAQGLVLVATSLPYYKAWPVFTRPLFLLFGLWVKGVAVALRSYPGHKLAFGGHEARTVMVDWFQMIWRGIYRFKGCPHHLDSLLGQLNKPVLLAGFTDDRYAPPSTLDYTARAMGQAQVDHWTFSPQEVGLPTLGHFLWTRQPGWLAPRLAQWIARHTAQPKSG